MAVPRYQLRERAFIKPIGTAEAWLHEAGEAFDYAGPPGRTWLPLNDEATAALALLAPLTAMSENILPHRGTAP